MAQAARDADSGMIAVLSRGDLAAVAADIEAAGLTPANFNGSGQIVAAGGRAELDAFIANPSAGVKVIPLKVAGAFHSPYMLAARARLEDARATFSASTPRYPIYTNRDGSRVTDGTEYLDDLIAQVAHPVRWDMCQESFLRDGVDALIELTPAGTLTGLARKGLPGVPTVALKTPEDIEAARALLQ